MNPALWLAAQRLIGGTPDKQKIARNFYHGGSILEIGCSVGNIAEVFQDAPRYVGHDIDSEHIAYAKKRLPHATFTDEPLSKINGTFDLVLVAGVLHHVKDETAIDILTNARRVAGPQGAIISYDPLPLNRRASLVRHFIDKLEQGRWLRTIDELISLYTQAGLTVETCTIKAIHAYIFPKPAITDLAILVARR